MPKGVTNATLGNFAPRIGMVWDPEGNGRTSIRAAYGILYDIPPLQYFDRFGFGPPWASTITIVSPVGGFTDPFLGYPGGNPFPQPSPPPADATFVQAGQYVNLPLKIKPTYMQQWNVSIQRQLGDAWLLSANYIGNKSTHRWIKKAINPAVYIPGNCGAQPCSTTGNTNARRILALANPTLGRLYGPMAELDDGSNASYGAFTFDVALLRRFSVTERFKLETRAEAFNVLNHPVFNNPRNSIIDANFGRILTANDPRIMQFAMKVIF